MKRFFTVWAVILWTAGAAIAAEMPDYSYGMNLTGEFSADEVYKFPIPLKVYEKVTDKNLSDIALFNSAGEKVPFTLVRPKPSSYTTPADTSIVFDKDTYERDNKTYIRSLLSDIAGISGDVKEIRFLFDEKKDFNGKVNIAYSTGDLGRFNSIAYDITLAKLGRITQDKAGISRMNEGAVYIKISGDHAALDAITGAILSFRAEPVYDRIEKAILSGVLNKTDNILDFKLTGYYPVEFISLKVSEAYLFNEVRINTAEQDNQTDLLRGFFGNYSVLKGVSGYPGNDIRTKRIRIEFEDPFPADSAANFYWRADEAVFIAKGDAPFTLAFGNISEKGKSAATYEELAKLSDEAAGVELSDVEFIIAGEAALIPPPEESHTARRAVLLGFMFLTVLLVSGAAIRLLVKNSGKQSG
jgi:hypothetical protein